MFNRQLNLTGKKSFFLFGARGAGKSTLLQKLFPHNNHLWVDLLDPEIESRLLLKPQLLYDLVEQSQYKSQLIIIDEIQKAPKLLDIVHQLIHRKKMRFALTGSSARKLKRGAANLLAGRAFVTYLFPLTQKELGKSFELENILQWGSLPDVIGGSALDKIRYLNAYTQTYLKEEILAEQIIRKARPFRAFLEVAAQSNGQILSYSKIARDIQSDPVSVQSYFQILEDTLVGMLLAPYHSSIRKRQRHNPKFYFFDLGVHRALAKTLTIPLAQRSYAYGKAFEHFLILEIHRRIFYAENPWSLSYLRTKDDAEIDLIIERPGDSLVALEIKSTDRIDETEVRRFEAIAKDLGKVEMFFLSKDPVKQKVGKVTCIPWADIFDRLEI